MSPPPQRGSPPDVVLEIRRLARKTEADVQELLTLHVLECLLARIARSPYRDDFVLKGGVLLAAFALRRPTRDVDLQAIRLSRDINEVAARKREIASIRIPDGVEFDVPRIRVSEIREDDEYSGVRVKLVGMVGRARLTIGVDVNFGDPIWPSPQAILLPRIADIGLEPVHVQSYPLTMVLAEKIVTAVDRGAANTRWRDYADILSIIGRHVVDANVLARTLDVVAEYRDVDLEPLLPRLDRMSTLAQSKWQAWRARVRREEDLPKIFAEVLDGVAAFADPVIGDSVVDMSWSPSERRWTTSHDLSTAIAGRW
jgi:hypothetical protein